MLNTYKHNRTTVTADHKTPSVLKKENWDIYGIIFDNSLNMMDILDDKRRIIDANSIQYKVLGYKEGELVGLSISDIIHPDFQKATLKKLDELIEKQVNITSFETALITRNGEKIHVELSTFPGRQGDKTNNYGIIFQDLTERRILQDKLRDAVKSSAISTLTSGIAHNFNTSLFHIIGFTEMTMDDVPEGSLAYENLKKVLKAADGAAALVGQILSFSHQVEQKLKPLMIQSLVKEMLKLLKASLPSTIEIKQKIDPDCWYILADPTQVYQLFMNICTNAYHAIDEKSGIIEVRLENVLVIESDITPAPGQYVLLTVTDTGHGMSNEIIKHIFEPSFTTKRPGEGTGMGLALGLEIVKNYGGEIKVESQPGRGTSFRVYIPRDKSAKAQEDKKLSCPLSKGGEHILLIDDEEQSVQMLKQMLGRLGYNVTARTSGKEILDIFKENKEEFDLVITDLIMPNVNGEEIARRIMDIRKDIPIIVITGFDERMTREDAEELGIKEYIMKPIMRNEIATAIRRVLDT